jgi:hypothetical protein
MIAMTLDALFMMNVKENDAIFKGLMTDDRK